MMNRIYRFVLTGSFLVTVVAMLSFTACNKESVTENSRVALRFSSELSGAVVLLSDEGDAVATKAAAVTSVTDFFAMGFNGNGSGTEQYFPKSGTSPVRVKLSGSGSIYIDEAYLWSKGDIKTFFAYSNNLPTSGATASIASTGVTLTYNDIPTTAAAQTDVTLGRYSGDGNNTGTAAMTFYHPLAQLEFKVGTIVDITAISNIQMVGVYNGGSVTLNTSTTVIDGVAQFSWTGKDGSATVSQELSDASLSEGSTLGVPFMLIPQDFVTQNITIRVTATVDGSTKVLTTTISSDSIASGKKSVCTINYNPFLSLTATLTEYTVLNPVDPTFGGTTEDYL